MGAHQEEIDQCFSILIEGTYQLRGRLVEAGFDKSQVDGWLLCVDTLLRDWRRTLRLLIETHEETDMQKVPVHLWNFAEGVLYETMLVSEENMRELEQRLWEFFPSDWDDLDKDDLSDSRTE